MVPTGIVKRLIGVLAAIQFHDDRAVETSEVTDVETNLMLAAEFEATELTTAQATPEEAFDFRWTCSKTTSVSPHAATKHIYLV